MVDCHGNMIGRYRGRMNCQACFPAGPREDGGGGGHPVPDNIYIASPVTMTNINGNVSSYRCAMSCPLKCLKDSQRHLVMFPVLLSEFNTGVCHLLGAVHGHVRLCD